MIILADGIDITAYTGGLSWKNTILELATTMSFETAKTNMQYMNMYKPSVGSIINLITNAEIFRGIVITVDDGDEKVNRYTVTDFGWYLNKSKETYQFNQMPAYKALRKVCEDFNIQIDTIPQLEAPITKIYFDKTISDIISDILDTASRVSMNFDVTPSGLRIYFIGDIIAYPQFRLSQNTHLIYSPTAYGGKSHDLSISDLKNSIKVITEKDEVVTVKTVLRDEGSISKFGLLQDVIKIDPEKENAATVGKQKLDELNRVTESFSIEIIEAIDSYTRAGSVLSIDNGQLTVDNYLIEGSAHSISNDIHKVKLDLRKI